MAHETNMGLLVFPGLKAGAIEYQPIGIIHTRFKEVSGMPIQPTGALGEVWDDRCSSHNTPAV